jgi:fatty acid desaturase
MPVVARVDPKTVFTPAEWSRLTSRSSLRGLWLVVHAWGTIAAAIALVTLWPNPVSWLIAVMVVGARQLGLAILMHEAAHGGIHGNKAINEWVGQWLCAVPVGADLASYRSYHLQHHRFTQQPEDPDLSLSAPFPITKESFFAKRSAISPARLLSSSGCRCFCHCSDAIAATKKCRMRALSLVAPTR